MSRTARPSICIIDDEASFQASVRLMLKPSGYGLVSYSNAKDFLESSDFDSVKCILLDFRMPGVNGLEFVDMMRARNKFIPVILVSAYADIPLSVKAVKAGCFDVLEKPFTSEQLLRTLEAACKQFDEWQRIEVERSKISERLAKLTPRETQVLDEMVAGKKNKSIAEDLGISPKTLDIHRTKVMEKMQARTPADLVRWRILARTPPSFGAYVEP